MKQGTVSLLPQLGHFRAASTDFADSASTFLAPRRHAVTRTPQTQPFPNVRGFFAEGHRYAISPSYVDQLIIE